MDATEQLGFGFPSFQSQSRGTRANRGPWIVLSPRVRALESLPPKAKAKLAGLARLRGTLGEDGYDLGYDYGGNGYDYSQPDYGYNSTSPWYSPDASGSGDISKWGTDETAGGTRVTTSAPTSGSGWSWESIAKGAATVSQAVAQQRIIDLNIERAKRGLPLLDPKNFSPSAAVNFGLTPQASQMLLYGGLALGAILLLKGRARK